MRFLLDVCIASHDLVSALRLAGHDVITAATLGPGVADETLIDTAFAEQRVLITADKDFGKLVFVERRQHSGVLLLSKIGVRQQCLVLPRILALHEADLCNRAFITLSVGRVRVRRQRDDLDDDG